LKLKRAIGQSSDVAPKGVTGPTDNEPADGSQPTAEVLLVENLRATYSTAHGLIRAVDGVSFKVGRGDRIGLVGESGCGKTTMGRALLRLLPPNATVEADALTFMGRDVLSMPDSELRRVRWGGISMVFQNALSALNPVKKIGSQIAIPISTHMSLSRGDTRRRIYELLEMVRLRPNVAGLYPHQLSGGMRQRVMIAMALSCDPSLVIADEPTTSLDVVRQDEILAEIEELQARLGFALIIVTHDTAIVAETCDRTLVMYAGTLVEAGRTSTVLGSPSHPYTLGLVRSAPGLEDRTELYTIGGRPPDLTHPPTGCLFHPRCSYKAAICERESPRPRGIAGGTKVRCHFAEDVNAAASDLTRDANA
jgi:oligopeptide/dipeptide ABC transporter ATP-binding protein